VYALVKERNSNVAIFYSPIAINWDGVAKQKRMQGQWQLRDGFVMA
jgi:hypothetical protein